jgi:hypothetical protein
MRSLGLYNVPPSYCDDFPKHFKRSCPNHKNSKNNLSGYIRPCKSVFSPYEKVEVEVGIINHSNIDTMYCYIPYCGESNPWSGNNLDVRDSTNHKFDLVEVHNTVSYAVIIDSYGRRLDPSIFADGRIINPQDTLSKILKFIAGRRYPDLLKNRFTLLSRIYAKRENLPGKYTVHYEQNHEEFDEIRGPVEAGQIVSDTVEYYVRDYTPEELNLKKDVADILEGLVGRTHSRNTTDSLITLLSQRYPDNFYLETVKGYAAHYAHSDSIDAAKSKK